MNRVIEVNFDCSNKRGNGKWNDCVVKWRNRMIKVLGYAGITEDFSPCEGEQKGSKTLGDEIHAAAFDSI